MQSSKRKKRQMYAGESVIKLSAPSVPLSSPNASTELPHNTSALSSPFMGAPSATSSLKFKTYNPSTALQKRTPVPGTAVLRPATPSQSTSRVIPSPAAPSETYAGVLSSRAQTPKHPTVSAEALAYPSPPTPIDLAYDSLASHPTSTQFGGSSRATPASKRQGTRFSRILDVMREENVSVPEFLLHILQSSSPACRAHQTAFYKASNMAIPRVLEALYDDEARGRPQLTEWVEKKGLHMDLACTKLAAEVVQAKDLLHMSSQDVSLEYLENWNLCNIVQPVIASSPILDRFLDVILEKTTSMATPTEKAQTTFKYLVVSTMLHARSYYASKVQHALGLFAWSTGASRHMIEVTARAHLTPSFTTIQNTLRSLADDAIRRVIAVIDSVPHAFTYDNVNFSHSEFIKQRLDTPAKVQSGSFCVIYELYGARFRDMEIAPMMERLKKSTDLTLADITTSRKSARYFREQTLVHILRVLATHETSFAYLYEECPEMLRHEPRRPLPPSHRTKYYSLRARTIEEASVEGNIRLQDDAYLTQLKCDEDPERRRKLSLYAIPTYADLLTILRARGIKILRLDDVDSWHRRDVIQLAMGLFHVTMNLIWAIRQIHYGASNHQPGGLDYFFTVMEKARLGNEKPDYHSLLAALTQVFEELLLNAWRQECGHDTLRDFARTSPTPSELRKLAERILKDYMTPARADSSQAGDTVYENTRLFLRDMRYVVEIVQAVKDGDFGRVEDMYPDLARIFRGAGCNNYASEVLHWIHNVKKVWTPAFADIMRDNSIVNVLGKFMPIDLNIEHLIGVLKELFAAKGIYSTWDRLGDVAACIDAVQCLKKSVGKSLATSYKSQSHRTPDTAALVQRVAAKAKEDRLQERVLNREENKACKVTTDLHAAGQKRLETTLVTFNKKMRAVIQGKVQDSEVPAIEEVDELVVPDFVFADLGEGADIV